MKSFFKEIFTDALGRIEIKNVIAVPMICAGSVVGVARLLNLWSMTFTFSDWLLFMGFFGGMIVTTAVTDAINDSNKGV